LYRNCDLFWINSLHEGFCVPAVEAMAFGLPILSSTYGALPETCGDAAEYGHSVSDFAAKVVKLLSDDHARCALGSKGRERYEQRFGGAGLRNHFLAMFDELLGSLAKPVPAASLPRDGYWFHLPDAEWLIDTAISVSGPLPVNALDGRERRADFVDWILRDAWRSSSEIAEYLTGRAFMEYASDIEVPVGGRYLSARQRLIWKFHRFASCRFDLQNGQAVADYMQWFNREATGLYGLMPGELEVERATTSDFPVINVKPRLAGPVDLLPNESRAFQ
jgi:hypothetical protein